MQRSVCSSLDMKSISGVVAATQNETRPKTQPPPDPPDTTTMDSREESNIAGDRSNLVLLTYLYGLECVPRCTWEAIALVLQKRNVDYADQAVFSLAPYSYCVKLLWAPIVDCVYFKKMGRRKTWTISSLYLIGISLLYMSVHLDDWLGSEDGTRKPQTRLLTLVYFASIFFATIESIAVSGWSLTMLRKRNVGHASMCDNIGCKISQFASFVLFIVLESKEFCNTFRAVPQDRGLVSFSGSLFFWAMVFIVSATLLLLFKKETAQLVVAQDDHAYRLGLRESYTRLWQIMKIRPVQLMCLVFLTYQVGSGPVNGLARLKLIDAGVPGDTFALLTAPTLPFLILVPLALSRYLTGHLAMRTFTITYMFKLLFGVVYAAFIFFTPFVKDERGALPGWHYWLLLLIYNAHAMVEHLMFISVYAFFSRISDPRFGGIYVTLFSAAASVGFRWPQSVCLWLVDQLTIHSCEENQVNGLRECVVVLDGFYIEVIAGVLIGTVWLYWAKRRIYKLEDMDRSEWLVKSKSYTNDENKNMNEQVQQIQ